MITTEQKKYVQEAIIDVSGVKYQDFYEEMNDHYLSSIESQMADGKDFEAAFVAVHESFFEHQYTQFDNFGGCTFFYGLQAMEMEYYDKMRKSIKQRHWEIVKSYFGWPTVVTTILVAALAYQFTDWIASYKQHFAFYVILLSFAIPFFILFPTIIRETYLRLIGKNPLISSTKTALLNTRIILIANVLNVVNLSKLFFDYDVYSKAPVPVLAAIFFVFLIYSASFWQLYHEQFKVTIA